MRQTHILLFFLLIFIYVAGALLLPITMDEAYYFRWADFPDFGYFDHPPAVAWWMLLGKLFPFEWTARLGTMISAGLCYWVFISLCRKLGFRSVKRITLALCLFYFNLFGLVFGVLTTPDIPMIFFWLLALHEAAEALNGQDKRWLSAGLFTGMGMLGKYTMVLIGPVFLWSLLRKPGGLKSKWPYLGGIVCLLTFMPNIYWNYSHDWISYRFQANRGLKHSHKVTGSFSEKLPHLSPYEYDKEGLKLAEYFLKLEKPKKRKKQKSWIEKSIQRVSSYWAGQIAIWGLLAFVAIWRFMRKPSIYAPGWAHEQKHLILAATVVPLAFFGIMSIFQKVEANWPATYLVGASILLARYLHPTGLLERVAFGLHSVLILLLFLHAYFNFPLSKPQKDRVLQETFGYRELAHHRTIGSGPIFCDTYQLSALLHFYRPEKGCGQWPGLTRHSELTRRSEATTLSFAELKPNSPFQLITSAIKPPKIPEFKVTQMTELKACLSGIIATTSQESEAYVSPCKNPVHRWFLYTYDLTQPLKP